MGDNSLYRTRQLVPPHRIIVGLRPFGSQLLCEQVVGRALRRRSYALNEETDQFKEDTDKVFGVPFELVPFKVTKTRDSKPPKEPNHVFSDPDKEPYEIEFPLVEGYYSPQNFKLSIAWERVSQLTIDPKQIPGQTETNSMTAPEGALAVYGPGQKPVLTAGWRQQFRDQQVAFVLAREVCKRWQMEQGGGAEKGDVAVPFQSLCVFRRDLPDVVVPVLLTITRQRISTYFLIAL